MRDDFDMGPDEQRPGAGFLIMLCVALLFWTGVSACTGAVIENSRANSANPRDTCERLIDYGWDVQMSDCVQALIQ